MLTWRTASTILLLGVVTLQGEFFFVFFYFFYIYIVTYVKTGYFFFNLSRIGKSAIVDDVYVWQRDDDDRLRKVARKILTRVM